MNSLGKIAPEDIDGLAFVFKTHANQMAKRIALHQGVHISAVLDVLRQRGTDIFASPRILAAVDHGMNFSALTFVWSDNDAIYVHLGDHIDPRGNPVSQFRDSELLGGEYSEWARAFYKTNRRFVADGSRKINGTEHSYVSLKLPSAPFVADRLIEIISPMDGRALIARSVYALTGMSNADFLPARKSEHGLPARRRFQ